MNNPVLVTEIEEVTKNISQFAAALKKPSNTLIDLLSQFRAWYAIPDPEHKGRYLFAPSKFIGYKEMNYQKYSDNHRSMDGRKTEVALQKWFLEVHGEELQSFEGQLTTMLNAYGKDLCRVFRISILHEIENNGSVSDEEISSSFFTLYLGQSESVKARVKNLIINSKF